MRQSKSEQIKASIQQNDFKKALGITRQFFYGFTKDEMRVIEIACDCIAGRSSFYTTLGIDTHTVTEQAKEILKAKFAK